jgi:hypothetical protein
VEVVAARQWRGQHGRGFAAMAVPARQQGGPNRRGQTARQPAATTAMGSVMATQRRQKAQRQRNGDGNSGNGNDGDDGDDGDDGNDDGDGDKDDGDGNGWRDGDGRRDGDTTAMAALSEREMAARDAR